MLLALASALAASGRSAAGVGRGEGFRGVRSQAGQDDRVSDGAQLRFFRSADILFQCHQGLRAENTRAAGPRPCPGGTYGNNQTLQRWAIIKHPSGMEVWWAAWQAGQRARGARSRVPLGSLAFAVECVRRSPFTPMRAITCHGCNKCLWREAAKSPLCE